MGRKKKFVSELQQLKEKNLYQIQDFEQPIGIDKRHIRLTHYMMYHINYRKLSSSAMVVLSYMKDWAFASEEYIRTKKFDFSTTMLSNLGVMSNKTTMRAFEELQHYGFIQKENNATKDSGITQKWSFTCEWYKGEKEKF